ncbi:unnamed protein product [Linum tenue]|uniref:Uncharacterized protein n=1 Tax=Linum tenue TaxID=586396 RepID=A0AAV0NAN1_9ROSI|nr:unnamed protein product [Linum tenue]
MEVSVISTENIKPAWSAGSEHEFKPYKLSLLDQLMFSTHSPIILFYPMKDGNDQKSIARRLKSSLSKTLNRYYPIAGRVKDNLIIHDFERGVPFTEARVKGHRLSDLLSSLHGGPRLEFLNNMLPFEPFCYHEDATEFAQLDVQLNTFDCGGIAIGLNMHHKLMDGATASAFFHTWAANCNGSSTPSAWLERQPELCKSSSVFHPRESIAPEYHSFMKDMYFQDVHRRRHKGVSRRFVFDNGAIATLRTKARSSRVVDPTRLEALSAFI